MSAITVTVDIDLPSDDMAQLWIATRLGTFIERVRSRGADVRLRPSPDEIEAELATVRAELDAIEGHREEKRRLEAQIGRIERLNKFRQLVP